MGSGGFRGYGNGFFFSVFKNECVLTGFFGKLCCSSKDLVFSSFSTGSNFFAAVKLGFYFEADGDRLFPPPISSPFKNGYGS